MITQTQLQQLYPRASSALLPAMAGQIGGLFDEFQIAARPTRTEFFLAQVGHESGGGIVAEENMNYSAPRLCVVWPKRFPSLAAASPYAGQPEKLANFCYANRMGNGPPESGDGWRYRGRGLIQITGRDGYTNVGRIAGLDLVNHPELAFDPNHALRVACAFWAWKGLNPICDTGDFEKLTRRINGGTVGLPDRRAWLAKVRRVLAPKPNGAGQLSAETVRRLQLELRRLGYRQVGAADGLVGEHTMSAVTAFRRDRGLPPGDIDDQLLGILLPS